MPVAKSYAALTIEEGPYVVNGRQYCKVRQNNGTLKQVRWYSEAEYNRMYPEARVNAAGADRKTQREVLGFEKGYITIFKGDTYANLEWFKRSIARYCRMWGWYIISTEEIPADLPTALIPIRLPWELVGQTDGSLKPETAITKAIEPLLYEKSASQFQGHIGDRLDIVVTIQQAIPLEGAFGVSTMHIMKDDNENVYVWTTASKCWNIGARKHIRGTVKNHQKYKECEQTILSRCYEYEEE